MNCLNCDVEMINHHILTKKDEISYDTCDPCGSFWLDKGELDKIAYQVEGSIEVSSDKRAITDEKTHDCPRCDGEKLKKVFFIGHSDIVIDRCDHCEGWFLDGKELDAINKELESIMDIQGKGFSDFVANAHIPFWYRRQQKKSSETDVKKEVLPIKGSNFLKDSDMACPVCQKGMKLYSAHKVEYEGCDQCKGLWLDEDELRKLKDKWDKENWTTLNWMDDEIERLGDATTALSELSCPKCQKKLMSVIFGESKVVLDFCLDCKGVWLDRDEFKGIVNYLGDKIQKISSDEVKGKIKEELKEIFTGPENILSEIMDAKAVLSAFFIIKHFEDPKKFNRAWEFWRVSPFR